MPLVVAEDRVFAAVASDVSAQHAMHRRFLDAARTSDATVDAITKGQLPRPALAEPHHALLIDQHQSEHRIVEERDAVRRANAFGDSQDARFIWLETMDERTAVFERPGVAVGQRHEGVNALPFAEHDLILRLQGIVEPLHDAIGQTAEAQAVAIDEETELADIDFAELRQVGDLRFAVFQRDELGTFGEFLLDQHAIAADPNHFFGLGAGACKADLLRLSFAGQM